MTNKSDRPEAQHPTQQLQTLQATPVIVRRKKPGIGVNTESLFTLDVRILRVAQRFPYMFGPPDTRLQISKDWTWAFTRTCEGIDALLGEDTRGFRWCLLTQEDGIPYWYWKLDDEFNKHLVLERSLTETSVRIVNPPRDPYNDLRDAIGRLVLHGQMHAKLAAESVQRKGGAV